MKIKFPSSDTMDKVVLGVAVAGVATAFLLIKNLPTPTEQYSEIEITLEKMIALQNETNNAISKQDYYTACLTQQDVVTLALENNLDEVGLNVDGLIKLEELVCHPEDIKELI